MQPNKLTRGHNLLWESSRMMLPEHKELIEHHQQRIRQQTKPQLDEQEIEWLEQRIQKALYDQSLVQLTLFDPYQSQIISGVIVQVDSLTQRLLLQTPQHQQWILFHDLIDVK
ncbi:YolD-like family protein [Aquisalibacillus elongatus]|uniref:YolD-like protein n=1 Tax=Aquisalibacillus elongatus TaxID=485577 RepID=A0A3N5C868_9BACI|nr:YolD-like family protein [Aquisalibacillus elongatus]RPF55702.1 YolD-like protein [Aquisalibacillus elongatus]